MISAAVRHPRDLSAVALAAAGAWVGVLLLARGGMPMGSTMGLTPPAFVGAWTLMMAAMMLPAVAPVAALYARTLDRGGGSVVRFATGYLLVWAALGIPAFGLAVLVDGAAMDHPAAFRPAVIVVLIGIAAYQLTPLKRFCLDHCRSPLAQFLDYAGYRGRLREVRVGVHHGLYCCGCCWPLMVLLVAVGTMNVAAMLALTALTTAEKLLPQGVAVSRAAAAAAIALAAAVAVSPAALAAVAGR